MSRDFTRGVTVGTANSAPTWAALLDDLTADWLSQVAECEGVRAAGRRAAYALVQVSGFDPDESGWPSLTVTASAEGVARATGVSRVDIVRGTEELTRAGLLSAGKSSTFLLGTSR